jgi:hypothetical protein
MSHEQAYGVLLAIADVPAIGLRYSALGETRGIKDRPRTRPSRLHAGDSATAALGNDRPTAI